MNDPAQLLSIFLDGALGRSGRKRARKAAGFISGKRGFLTASSVLAAAGVAWGIYDSMKGQKAGTPVGAVVVPPVPGPVVPIEVLRIIRLAVSAARADGALTAPERALILDHARKAGVAAAAEQELDHPHALADIVRGVTDEQARRDLYTLAFTIVRADEAVTGGERIYLAQLAHQLGLDPAATAGLESAASGAIDAAKPEAQSLEPKA